MAKIPNYTRGLVLERATPNQVNLGQIEAAGAGMQGAAQVLDVGAQVAQKIKQTNDLTATNSSVIKKKRKDLEDINTFEKENRDNPIDYAKRQEEWLKERDKSYLESLPSDEARQSAQREFDLINLAHFKDAQTAETEMAAIKFVNEAEETVEDIKARAYRGETLESVKSDFVATGSVLSPVLSEGERAKWKADKWRGVTESYIQGAIDTDPYDAKKLLDSREYDEALGADKLNTLSDKVELEIKRIEDRAIKERSENLKLLQTDPVKLVQKAGIAEDDYDGLIDAQRKVGVPEGALSILSKERASLMAFQTSKANSADEVIQGLSQMQQQYGEYTDLALRDMKVNGLSENTALIAIMDFTEDRNIIEAVFQMGKDGKSIKETAYKGTTTMQSDIDTLIADKTQDTLDVIRYESNEIEAAKLQSSMQDIATFFIAQGEDAESAANKATQWLLNKTNIAQIDNIGFLNSNHKVRVPQGYTPDDIEAALELALEDKQIYKDESDNIDIKRNGRFVLTPNEDKYYLRNAVNRVVLDSDDKVMYFPVADIVREMQASRERIAGGYRDKEIKDLRKLKENKPLMDYIEGIVNQ